MGIIGPNGAGKSTLLKILSRIAEPTEGYAEVRGRVGSLLEIGTGFHPELTGRENIYLNAAILGMKKSEIDARFDEIVAFSGLERFIETRVKYYSSGMYVRLAFSVAAYVDTEIMLVDEVLAVGDAEFQRKCLGKMEGVARQGRTVLFVSHNMGAIRALCRRAIRLEHGRIVDDGGAHPVVMRYLDTVNEGFVARARERTQKPGTEIDPRSTLVEIERMILRNSQGEKTVYFTPGEDVVVELHFRAKRVMSNPIFWIDVLSVNGILAGADMEYDGCKIESIDGTGIVSCKFRSIPLLPQVYTVHAGVRHNGVEQVGRANGFFNVTGSMADFGFKGELADQEWSWRTGFPPVVIPYEWRFPNGRVVPVEISTIKRVSDSAATKKEKQLSPLEGN